MPTYAFVSGPFGACSVTCGCGTQMRNVTCQETLNDTVTDVSDGVCVRQGLTVPARQRTCNNFTCPNWRVGSDFGQVSYPCTHVTVSPLHPRHCRPCTHVTVSPLHPRHCVTPAPTSLCRPCTHVTMSPLHPRHYVTPAPMSLCHPCTHVTVPMWSSLVVSFQKRRCKLIFTQYQLACVIVCHNIVHEN